MNKTNDIHELKPRLMETVNARAGFGAEGQERLDGAGRTKMSKHAHTPGPWEYFEFFDYVSIHAKGKEIAQVLTDDKTEEQRANASLVMAAPELLECCEVACDRCMSISIAPQCETCKMGRAIIKARLGDSLPNLIRNKKTE